MSRVTVRTGVQERSRERHERLLRAAVELIGEGGPRAATHRAVSARAGLPPSTAGYYFPTSDGLIEGALLSYAEQRSTALTATLSAALDGVSDLGAVADAIARTLLDDAGTGMLAEFEVYLEAARNPALREGVAAAMSAFEDVAASRLEALGLDSPRLAAKAFVAVANGFALNRLAAPMPYEEDLQLVTRTLVGLYVAFGGPTAGLPDRSLPVAGPEDRNPRAGGSRRH